MFCNTNVFSEKSIYISSYMYVSNNPFSMKTIYYYYYYYCVIIALSRILCRCRSKIILLCRYLYITSEGWFTISGIIWDFRYVLRNNTFADGTDPLPHKLSSRKRELLQFCTNDNNNNINNNIVIITIITPNFYIAVIIIIIAGRWSHIIPRQSLVLYWKCSD